MCRLQRPVPKRGTLSQIRAEVVYDPPTLRGKTVELTLLS